MNKRRRFKAKRRRAERTRFEREDMPRLKHAVEVDTMLNVLNRWPQTQNTGACAIHYVIDYRA